MEQSPDLLHEVGVTHEDDPSILMQDPDSTLVLLARARRGDRDAISSLVRRYLPSLRRWAHGRLPARSRDIADTDDLVQSAFMHALERLDRFEPRHAGAFPAYLRTILLNAMRDEARRSVRRPGRVELEDVHADPNPTPLQQLVGDEALQRYERAMSRLSDEHRGAIALRIELGLAYREIGELLGGRTENAARLLVVRAVRRLAEEMSDG